MPKRSPLPPPPGGEHEEGAAQAEKAGGTFMGILDRVSTMLRANINALLDQAEDPEKMMDQIIRDMGEAIRQARGQVAEMIAQEKRLEADQVRNRTLADEWERKAELALQRGSEDLAKEALRRKIDFERNAQVYGQQLQSQEQVVGKLKGDLGALESKFEQAKRDRDMLIARHRRAVAQQRVLKTAGELAGIDSTSEIRRLEDLVPP